MTFEKLTPEELTDGFIFPAVALLPSERAEMAQELETIRRERSSRRTVEQQRNDIQTYLSNRNLILQNPGAPPTA